MRLVKCVGETAPRSFPSARRSPARPLLDARVASRSKLESCEKPRVSWTSSVLEDPAPVVEGASLAWEVCGSRDMWSMVARRSCLDR